MDTDEIAQRLEGMKDTLATLEHERWSHWQQYMHSKASKQPDGSMIVPAELVERWERQMSTDFDELSESEKDSDRKQVDRYIPVIARGLSQRI